MTKHSTQPLDLAIIGAGPAALTAALYAARAGLSVTAYDQQHFGGALTEMAEITNFPGFVGTGTELASALKDQATAAGARVEYGTCEEIIPPQPAARKSAQPFTLTIDGQPVSARSVLVATGTAPRPFDFAALDLTVNCPVSYCALCDAPLYKGKSILVLGGGNSAVSEALHLSALAAQVTLVNRSPLRAQPALIQRLRAQANVTVLANTQLTQSHVDQADAIFVAIGKAPATSFVPHEVLDQARYIITDQHQMTTIPGLFAAGDVRAGTTKQAIVAAGDGANAALQITDYLKH